MLNSKSLEKQDKTTCSGAGKKKICTATYQGTIINLVTVSICVFSFAFVSSTYINTILLIPLSTCARSCDTGSSYWRQIHRIGYSGVL